MTLTTKTIINFLPFSPDAKLDLLEKYDSLPREEQLRISDIVWEAYYSIFEMKIRENFDNAIREAEKNGVKPDKNLYPRVVEETELQMENALMSANEATDLSAARRSMEKIVKEINAAKKSKPN